MYASLDDLAILERIGLELRYKDWQVELVYGIRKSIVYYCTKYVRNTK